MHYYLHGAGKRESKSSREAGAIYQGEFAAIFGFVGCTCIQNSQEGIMSSLNVELHASRFSEAFNCSFGDQDYTTEFCHMKSVQKLCPAAYLESFKQEITGISWVDTIIVGCLEQPNYLLE